MIGADVLKEGIALVKSVLPVAVNLPERRVADGQGGLIDPLSPSGRLKLHAFSRVSGRAGREHEASAG